MKFAHIHVSGKTTNSFTNRKHEIYEKWV